MSAKQRLDIILVKRGLAESRTRAQALIMAGRVRSGTAVLSKAGLLVADEQPLQVIQPETSFASRGGTKLDAALEQFDVVVAGVVALDVGASTGGFTDVLLQRGASHVYAVDVGYGQLAWPLRQDARVTVLERTNIRYLQSLPGETPALATIDVSFISLAKVLPAVWQLLTPEGSVVALIKPQFEAGRGQVGKGGVVRSAAVHRSVLSGVLRGALEAGWQPGGLIASPLRGPAGNREFLALLGKGRCLHPLPDIDAAIDTVLAAAESPAPIPLPAWPRHDGPLADVE